MGWIESAGERFSIRNFVGWNYGGIGARIFIFLGWGQGLAYLRFLFAAGHRAAGIDHKDVISHCTIALCAANINSQIYLFYKR